MIVVAFGCLLTVLQSPASDSLRLLAVNLPSAALVLEVRQRPLAVPDAVTESLRCGELDAAGKIAAAYALASRAGACDGERRFGRDGRVAGQYRGRAARRWSARQCYHVSRAGTRLGRGDW